MRIKSTSSNLSKVERKNKNSSKSKNSFLAKSMLLANIKKLSAPVREEKIQKAKKRLAAGFYSSPKVNSLVAERIIQDLKYIKTTYPA